MNHPSMFRLVGIPRRFFGETHVVISVWRDGATWKAEYNILSKRPAEHLTQGVFEFDIADYPAELPPVDASSMEGDGLQQAEMYLGLELERLAMETNQEEFAYLPIHLERETITPVNLWTRSAYPQKFLDMASGTKSPDLKRYLQMVMSLSRLRPAN